MLAVQAVRIQLQHKVVRQVVAVMVVAAVVH
jgi:hypothetical protein